MLEFLKREANKTTTENGAATYVSTRSECLDLFATIGALRNASDADIIDRFSKAYAEDADLAMKTLFFARDIRGGLGERRVFKVVLAHLAAAEPESVKRNIENVAEYGRFDDLLALLDTPVEAEVLAYIEKTLRADIQIVMDAMTSETAAERSTDAMTSETAAERSIDAMTSETAAERSTDAMTSETAAERSTDVMTSNTATAEMSADAENTDAAAHISLLAKWLPSINASNKETVRKAKKIAKYMHMSEAEYRKTLAALRAQIKIIENNLRERDYSFNYEKQPSKALYKYRKAFIRNDGERYTAFITKAAEDPSVMHTGTLTPYDIVGSVISKGSAYAYTEEERRAMDATWNALDNYVGAENSLAVVDGSGSMYWGVGSKPAAVAESLGIYFAEHNTGAFHNHFITFSARPKLVEVKGRDILEKVRYCMGFNDCSNTNLEATFDLILNTAVTHCMTQADMPEKLYIISDMEFDCCAGNSAATNFERAKAKFEAYGYKLPQVVFWNVNSRNVQQPVTMNELGVALVSGCNPQIFSMLKEGTLEPYKFMMSVLGKERYARIVA